MFCFVFVCYRFVLKDEEKTLAEFLEKEYGRGTINIEEGVFIPNQSQEE